MMWILLSDYEKNITNIVAIFMINVNKKSILVLLANDNNFYTISFTKDYFCKRCNTKNEL